MNVRFRPESRDRERDMAHEARQKIRTARRHNDRATIAEQLAEAGIDYPDPLIEYDPRADDGYTDFHGTPPGQWDDPDICFICDRATNHVAEHDDLVDAGRAFYDGGDVRWTKQFTDARRVLDDELLDELFPVVVER